MIFTVYADTKLLFTSLIRKLCGKRGKEQDEHGESTHEHGMFMIMFCDC